MGAGDTFGACSRLTIVAIWTVRMWVRSDEFKGRVKMLRTNEERALDTFSIEHIDNVLPKYRHE